MHSTKIGPFSLHENIRSGVPCTLIRVDKQLGHHDNDIDVCLFVDARLVSAGTPTELELWSFLFFLMPEETVQMIHETIAEACKTNREIGIKILEEALAHARARADNS